MSASAYPETKTSNVINVLNKAHAMELTAIVQYNSHYTKLYRLDFPTLADQVKSIYEEELEHYNEFAERIRELDGEPSVILDATAKIADRIIDVFSLDKAAEIDAIKKYNEFQITCREEDDDVSATLFEEITRDEQKHLMVYTKIKEHIDMFGDSYLSNIASVG